MAKQTTDTTNTVEACARKLRKRFAEAGFAPIEPPILQPADTFIDMSGENIRRRLFMVQGNGHEELCLRPDLTIPVARIHLETNANKAALYCYAGPSFRRAIDETAHGPLGEFYQAGIEAFGFSDVRTDMKIVSMAISAIKTEGLENLQLNLGDPNLFRLLIDALDVPDFWRTRLLRHFWRRDLSTDTDGGLEHALTQMPDLDSNRDALATALGALDQEAGAELVEDVLALAGFEPVGGRTAEEIAARFMERAAMNAAPLADETIATIRTYLEIEGDPKRALSDLRTLFGNLNTDVSSYLNRLEEQIVSAQTALRDADGDQNAVRFDTKFGRNLEYYSGFIFEISDKDHPELRQIAGGGRYDRLMTGLGSPREIPATGCAIYVDRLLAATGAQS